jgi:hypothetical protein
LNAVHIHILYRLGNRHCAPAYLFEHHAFRFVGETQLDDPLTWLSTAGVLGKFLVLDFFGRLRSILIPRLICFAGGAYCQIRSATETVLAAGLLGRLGAKR